MEAIRSRPVLEALEHCREDTSGNEGFGNSELLAGFCGEGHVMRVLA